MSKQLQGSPSTKSLRSRMSAIMRRSSTTIGGFARPEHVMPSLVAESPAREAAESMPEPTGPSRLSGPPIGAPDPTGDPYANPFEGLHPRSAPRSTEQPVMSMPDSGNIWAAAPIDVPLPPPTEVVYAMPIQTGSNLSAAGKSSISPPSQNDDLSWSSVNGALYRRSPKGTTIQSDRVSISNSSVHTTSTAATCKDLFDYTGQNTGGVPSTSHRKSLYSLETPMFRFRNQSQSTVGTICEVGSVRSSIATSTSTQEIRSLNIPSSEDEDESPNDLLKASAPVFPDPYDARAREARVLESKVARVASGNCSMEEVTALQKEVDRWLTEVTAADASTALFLGSLLLKAILVNHSVFSDTSNASKNTEKSLKLKVDELEVELHMQKDQYDQKVQECQSLRRELSRFVTTPSVSSTSQ